MSERISFIPIEEMEPTFVVSALSETEDWGLGAAGIPIAHQHTKGTGVVVAVLDTGGPSHPDLNANLMGMHNASTAVGADDRQGHGTHVAGVIAAAANGFGVIGVAPEARIVAIKVLDDTGHSGYAQIERGIRLATAMGVDIINLSLGSTAEPPASLHDAVREAAAKGIIIIAAAGNDSGSVNFPARYNEVIAVAAVDRNGEMADFSSRGGEIAIGAPGVSIYSTYLNNQYALLSGTSQAAPFIAGVAALVLAWTRNNPSIPQIKDYQDMLQRLDDIADPAGRVGFHGRDGSLGMGIPRFCNDMPWK